MEIEDEQRRVTIQLKNEEGANLSSPFDVSVATNVADLQLLCNQLLETEETIPFAFYVADTELDGAITSLIDSLSLNIEKVIDVVYQPQTVFKVRAVTRCTSSLPGHTEAVISAQFSADGRRLASGSGDTTVRFWDVDTEMPDFTCKAHKNWVLCIAWSPDGQKLASACKNGQIALWNPETGSQIGPMMNGHKKWVTSLSWEPMHRNPDCRFLASSSKDGDVRVWDAVLFRTIRILAGHTASVTCVKWGGEGLIYSASQDRTIKVWRAEDGVLCRTLEGHGHWVNILALNTDYVMRTGAYDPRAGDTSVEVADTPAIRQAKALTLYNAAKGDSVERLVSGSDDFTLFLWTPSESKKPHARMTGHQQLVNHVTFSPDGRLLASASFDKSIKLWCGRTGKYLGTLRGHVQAVYQVAWSSDSRLLVSGSADSTLKLWDVRSRKLAVDLPGHADEVYAVDWSPDGQRVVSGGKDRVLRIWRK